MRAGRHLPTAAAAYLAHEVASALAHIHRQVPPIVHRDVTPHNVFVNRQGHVKLGDFGIAKTAARLSATRTGQIKGKLSYLAPEQLTRDPITPRTDVYALGIVLYELLTGARFARGETETELIEWARNPRVEPPSRRRPEAAPLDRLVLRTLDRHPAMRPANGQVVSDALAAHLAGDPWDAVCMERFCAELELAQPAREPAVPEPPSAPAPGPVTSVLDLPRGRERPATRPWFWGAALALLALGIGASVALWPDESREPPHAPLHAVTTPPGDSAAGAAPASPLMAQAIDAQPAPAADAGQRAVANDGPLRAPPAPQDARRRPAATGRTPRRRAAKRRAATRRPPKRRDNADPRTGSRPSGVADRAAPGRPAVLSPPPRSHARRVAAALADARARGLWPGDEKRFDRLLRRARREPSGGALKELERAAREFTIDRSFADRKLARLEAAISTSQLDAAQRTSFTAAGQRILRAILAGRLVDASNQISRAMQRLHRARRR